MREKTVRLVCAALFFLLCTGTAGLLLRYTAAPEHTNYVQWDFAVQIAADGTETPYDLTDFAPPEGGTSYRFTASLPQEMESSYLLFEGSGLDISLRVNGTELFYGAAPVPAEAVGLQQTVLPLPDWAAGGELELTVRPLGDGVMNVLFPPLPRLTPDPTDQAAEMAYANRSGIPAGASALAFVLVCGLFLLGLSQGRRDWHLIPLTLAAAVLTFQPLAVSAGYWFLPEALFALLSWRGWALAIPAALLLYLFLERRQGLLRQLGVAAAWSAGALGCAYLASLARGAYLSGYLNHEVTLLFTCGHYDGLLYWLNLWLVTVCSVLSVYGMARSILEAKAEAQSLIQRERLAVDGYRALEQKNRDTAALRHEMSHQIAALQLLYRQQDMEGLGALLAELRQRQASLAQQRFTENFAIDAILQDAAARASRDGISFEAQSLVPKELPIPISDLCSLLMNLLENALEGAGAVPDAAGRFVRFRTAVKEGYLTVSCENSYAGPLKLDEKGHLQSVKPGPEPHGLGMRQMRAVAEKYHSILNVTWTQTTFTVQTALLLPDS